MSTCCSQLSRRLSGVLHLPAPAAALSTAFPSSASCGDRLRRRQLPTATIAAAAGASALALAHLSCGQPAYCEEAAGSGGSLDSPEEHLTPWRELWREPAEGQHPVFHSGKPNKLL